MQALEKISENKLINILTKNFHRSPIQINALQESDAELIRIPGTDTILAVTTDSIAEEIQSGLYDNPYLAGRMSVLVNLSDLSAVGAEPLGLIINETFNPKTSNEYIEQVQKGISDACSETNTFILGGDTNFSDKIQIGATAIGIIKDNIIITRKGCCAGDYLFSSGKLGSGNAFAFSKLFSNKKTPDFQFNPEPRIKEGILIRKYASCCMDTSDGVIATLDQLMRINNLGFNVDIDINNYLDFETLELCGKNSLPAWFTLAGIHGEFELLFTIQGENLNRVIKEANSIGWELVCLGKVIEQQVIQLKINNNIRQLNTEKIRNLFGDVNYNFNEYLNELIKMDNSFKENKSLEK